MSKQTDKNEPINVITDILQCPICNDGVTKISDYYQCRHCKRQYPITEGIIDFRIKEE